MNTIEAFTRHGESGVAVLDKDYLKWLENHDPRELGSKIIAYSWIVNGKKHVASIDIGKVVWHELPDATGFICFESDWKPDNCLLLDAFGKERMRLMVPWQFTRLQNPESVKPQASFANVSEPFVNPIDGRVGDFGVTAWIELAGKYYFELDYHTGQFLWGREIKD